MDKDLKDLVAYYGEDPSNTKFEDVFATIVSFAGMLIRTEEEMAESDRRKARVAAPKQETQADVRPPLPVVLITRLMTYDLQKLATPIRSRDKARSPMRKRDWNSSEDGRNSLGRSGFDNTLRHLRAGSGFGTRRERPLSKMFLDGAAR